jgi:hypothetical protein
MAGVLLVFMGGAARPHCNPIRNSSATGLFERALCRGETVGIQHKGAKLQSRKVKARKTRGHLKVAVRFGTPRLLGS